LVCTDEINRNFFGLVRSKIRTTNTDINHSRGLWPGQND
jgi:hypothetical protein